MARLIDVVRPSELQSLPECERWRRLIQQRHHGCPSLDKVCKRNRPRAFEHELIRRRA